jgi:Ca-activated chloride channel family protein
MPRTVIASLSVLVFLGVGCASFGDEGAYYEDPSRSAPPPSGSFADAGAAPPEEEPPPGDRYEDVGTNPFVRADHDPFSTFAADVDTASYDIFVREAQLGYLPQPASVRLEEYVNAFDYDYPAPEYGSEVPFAIDLVAATHPFRPEIAQLRVGIQAADPPELVQRPTNLVFLVDSSGSMRSEDKLPLVQQVIRSSLDTLRPTDTVSIVTYAGSTEVRLTPTRIEDRARIEAVVDGLEAAGSTNGASGIGLAYEQAEAGFLEGGFNHVVLCTDGDFNVGITDTEALVELIEDKRETGITLTALGFGRGNLNDAMMERVSNAGNGVYSVIVSQDHAVRYGSEDILRTAHFVAQDMKIQVEFNPEHVVAYRLLGYENRAIDDEDFRNDVVDAGEVGAGHRVTALYEVVLAGQSIPAVEGAPPVTEGEPVDGAREIAAHELVQVRVRWKDLGATAEDPAHETSSSLTPDDVFAALDMSVDRDFLWASAMAALAEMLKQNAYGDPAHLDLVREIAEAQASRDADRAQLAELLAVVGDRL